MKIRGLAKWVVGFWIGLAGPAFGQVTVDFAKSQGKIRALNGVGGGPHTYGENARLEGYHKEAAFPWARLHDAHWPYPDCVDVTKIFPIFDADPDDPMYYTWARTDDYLKAIVNNGTKIVYRLGESIEPWTNYHAHPPKDFAKWAKICVNIIRHYNDGWANGFKYGIQHWEIWNEPETGSYMWERGTLDQYLELYEVAARAIKEYNPELKVGGPGATHIRSGLVKKMLEHCRDREVPLDFLSWHCYTSDVNAPSKDSALARQLLDEYGFTGAESHLNEWRYLTNSTWSGLRPRDPKEYAGVPEWFARSCRAEGASYCGDVLIKLQDQPVDMVNFYSADASPWSMFGPFGIPTKVYHVFRAFNELLQTPNRVSCEGLKPDDHTVACAGVSDDGKTASILLSHFRPGERQMTFKLDNLPWEGGSRVKVYVVNVGHDLELTCEETLEAGASFQHEIPLYSVCLIKLSPAAP